MILDALSTVEVSWLSHSSSYYYYYYYYYYDCHYE